MILQTIYQIMKEHLQVNKVLLVMAMLVDRTFGDGGWAFTNPGLPACYVASTSLTQIIPKAYTYCYRYNYYGNSCDGRNLYCSINHNCCEVNGCPACCRARSSLNPGEIAGVVTASIVGAATILFIMMCICNRFCKRKKVQGPAPSSRPSY
ncbi:hypothetical protein CHS0354_021418 [Potamilus streckersoni]|uniref:Uncharacterized protein n=1 Tax=Potamilus streckersoni TaxID=2493646 RepID=A0AAE0S1V6_9BIVA|nr:hypothetical protein CHS0354_021418 [Potamilus streckersoni]